MNNILCQLKIWLSSDESPTNYQSLFSWTDSDPTMTFMYKGHYQQIVWVLHCQRWWRQSTCSITNFKTLHSWVSALSFWKAMAILLTCSWPCSCIQIHDGLYDTSRHQLYVSQFWIEWRATLSLVLSFTVATSALHNEFCICNTMFRGSWGSRIVFLKTEFLNSAATIHQPSIDIFEAFDELVLLKRGGETIYCGPLGQHSSELIGYFSVSHLFLCSVVHALHTYCWLLIWILEWCLWNTSWLNVVISQIPLVRVAKYTLRQVKIHTGKPSHCSWWCCIAIIFTHPDQMFRQHWRAIVFLNLNSGCHLILCQKLCL